VHNETDRMSDLNSFIQQCSTAINTQNGEKLKLYLTLYPRNDVPSGLVQANFPEPSEFDLYQLGDKFRPVVRSHFKMMKAIYISKQIKTTFDEFNEMCNHLIRAAEVETNWINVPLTACLTELLAVYKVRQQSYPEELGDYDQISGEELISGNTKLTSIEKLANTLNKAFKISLNDKNVDLSLSKRCDIYFFMSQLMKLYYSMKKLDLAKSIEKAIKGTRFPMPNMKKSAKNRKYVVTYLYYSAKIALDDGDFQQAQTKLDQAIEIIQYLKNYQKSPQYEKILFLAVPLKVYFGQLPKEKLWKYKSLSLVFKDLVTSIMTGNICKYQQEIKKFEIVLLSNHLYLLMEKLKQYVYVNLIKQITKIVQSQQDSSHIIPLSSYQIGFEYSRFNKSISWNENHRYYEQNEIECIIANLITMGKIKGYLSHGNRCLVLSKQNPFP